MALIVHKYGGTSMGSTERIRNVAKRVAKWARAGHRMVVVPSAMSGETNRLLGLANELAPSSITAEVMRELEKLDPGHRRYRRRCLVRRRNGSGSQEPRTDPSLHPSGQERSANLNRPQRTSFPMTTPTMPSDAQQRSPNSYRAGPDEKGFFGIFGGRFVAETLMP